MRRLFAILPLLVLPFFLHAQEKRVFVRSFDIDPFELRAKTDPVYDQNNQPCAMICIYFSSIDSVHFGGNIIGEPLRHSGEWIVFMPADSKWIDISVEGFDVLHYVFPSEKPLRPAYGYTLNLGITHPESLRTLIMPTLHFNVSHTSYGLMLGLCKKNGGYVRVLTDFNPLLNPQVSCSGDGTVDGKPAWFTGSSIKSRFAVTGGYMRQIFPALYAYAGAGYGRRVLAWEMYMGPDNYQYAHVDNHSFTGIEAEFGILYRISVFAMSAGVRTNQFKYVEATAGVGVMF